MKNFVANKTNITDKMDSLVFSVTNVRGTGEQRTDGTNRNK